MFILHLCPVLAPQQKRDMDILERLWQRVIEMMKWLKHLPCKEKLRELGLFIVWKDRLGKNSPRSTNICRESAKRKEPDSFQ